MPPGLAVRKRLAWRTPIQWTIRVCAVAALIVVAGWVLVSWLEPALSAWDEQRDNVIAPVIKLLTLAGASMLALFTAVDVAIRALGPPRDPIGMLDGVHRAAERRRRALHRHETVAALVEAVAVDGVIEAGYTPSSEGALRIHDRQAGLKLRRELRLATVALWRSERRLTRSQQRRHRRSEHHSARLARIQAVRPQHETPAAAAHATAEHLDVLCRHSERAVRAAAAVNLDCSGETFTQLAEDPATVVRARAAANPNCSAETLTQLVEDPEAVVRAAAAANLNCPPAIFELLARDPATVVRAAMAANPNCDPKLLGCLVLDWRHPVSEAAAANPNCPSHALDIAHRIVFGRASRDAAESAEFTAARLAAGA